MQMEKKKIYGKGTKKEENSDYFGTSGYSQEDIATAVLFTDNLGREETYTHTYRFFYHQRNLCFNQ